MGKILTQLAALSCERRTDFKSDVKRSHWSFFQKSVCLQQCESTQGSTEHILPVMAEKTLPGRQKSSRKRRNKTPDFYERQK